MKAIVTVERKKQKRKNLRLLGRMMKIFYEPTAKAGSLTKLGIYYNKIETFFSILFVCKSASLYGKGKPLRFPHRFIPPLSARRESNQGPPPGEPTTKATQHPPYENIYI
jgi:hypothetical protein